MAAARDQSAERLGEGQRHLSAAIGAYRGSALKRGMVAVALVSLALGVAGIATSVSGSPAIGGLLLGGLPLAFVVMMIWLFVPTLASQGAIAAEAAWTTSLPFQLSGYFEILAAEPAAQRVVTVEIRWQEGAQRTPERELLLSVVNAVDPQARVQHADDSGASFETGAISGQTGITINRKHVYRNHRIPAHLHGIVDQVLVTLHRSHPIAQVTLR